MKLQKGNVTLEIVLRIAGERKKEGMNQMKWNSDRSLHLSIWCTRLAMALVIVCGVLTPKIVNWYLLVAVKSQALGQPLMVAVLASCVPAMAALLCLHQLLTNIGKEEIFTDENVALLRRISWCCFAVAAIMLVSCRYYLVFLCVSVAAAFMGLILRVVKNVIQQAVILKAENELTI